MGAMGSERGRGPSVDMRQTTIDERGGGPP